MSKKTQYVNLMWTCRKHLSPAESMQKVVDFALLQDNALRSRRSRNAKASHYLGALIFTYPVYYLIRGFIDGCWNTTHQDHKLVYSFGGLSKNYRLMYRPEIYFRDKQELLYEIEKDNIEKEKNGQKPGVFSPIVLWHQLNEKGI